VSEELFFRAEEAAMIQELALNKYAVAASLVNITQLKTNTTLSNLTVAEKNLKRTLPAYMKLLSQGGRPVATETTNLVEEFKRRREELANMAKDAKFKGIDI